MLLYRGYVLYPSFIFNMVYPLRFLHLHLLSFHWIFEGLKEPEIQVCEKYSVFIYIWAFVTVILAYILRWMANWLDETESPG